ncbi:MAG: hypothetical protein LBP68_02385 [Acidobacteriota bacterium]|jgi:type IV secretion system protein VirB10|nr:hypothetical protein [Acidobacteriota bacterium]
MRQKLVPVFFCLLFFAWAAQAVTAQEQENVSPEIVAEAVTLPEGTVIPIVLTDYLNTRNSQVGDVFYADTTYPIWHNQKLIIPKGSSIRGTVTEVVRPGRIKGKGKMSVRFDDILLPNGVRQTLVATFRGIHGPGGETLDRKSESIGSDSGSADEDVKTVIGTTSTGALVGSIIGVAAGNGAKGLGIGGGAGAAAGIVQVLLSRGRDLVIEPGTRFDLELRQPMKFARNELEFSISQIEDAGRNLRPVPATSSPGGPGNRGGGLQRGLGNVWGFPGGRF